MKPAAILATGLILAAFAAGAFARPELGAPPPNQSKYVPIEMGKSPRELEAFLREKLQDFRGKSRNPEKLRKMLENIAKRKGIDRESKGAVEQIIKSLEMGGTLSA